MWQCPLMMLQTTFLPKCIWSGFFLCAIEYLLLTSIIPPHAFNRNRLDMSVLHGRLDRSFCKRNRVHSIEVARWWKEKRRKKKSSARLNTCFATIQDRLSKISCDSWQFLLLLLLLLLLYYAVVCDAFPIDYWSFTFHAIQKRHLMR